MNDAYLEILRDLPQFSSRFFIVRTKRGELVKFSFNRAQMYLHQRLEAQLKATGRVRAILLKGRQMGCTTKIQARFLHRAITSKGKKVFILTHETKATENIFDITKRLYENLPDGLCPKADTSTAKNLYFKTFDSGYAIGTAGTTGVGRSQTIQLFHGSETAFWPNAEEHDKGIMQAISEDKGTEIILESTANGIGNYFHDKWKGALSGSNGYQAIFIPWYWDEGYKLSREGFIPTEEEEELLKIYARDGLTLENLAWRRYKINWFSVDYETGNDKFKQEYPSNPQEAFLNPITNIFIPSKYVMKARKTDIEDDGKLIMGVDVAGEGKDKTAFIRRRPRKAYDIETFVHLEPMQIVGEVRRRIEQENPFKVYIDCIGIGAGVVSRLRELGYTCVEGINVGRHANQTKRFKNLRAELWSEMKDWFMQELPVQIPDEDRLHGELCSLGFKELSNGQLLIESKDELRARGMPSPDVADALALTFYGGFYGSGKIFEVQKRLPGERGMFT